MSSFFLGYDENIDILFKTLVVSRGIRCKIARCGSGPCCAALKGLFDADTRAACRWGILGLLDVGWDGRGVLGVLLCFGKEIQFAVLSYIAF